MCSEVALAAIQAAGALAIVHYHDGYLDENRYELVDKTLWADPVFARAAIRIDGHAFKKAPECVGADKEDVLVAVSSWGAEAFQYAADQLRADKDLALAVVAIDPEALRYTALPLRADRDLVRAAVSLDGGALRYADKELRLDEDILLACAPVRARDTTQRKRRSH